MGIIFRAREMAEAKKKKGACDEHAPVVWLAPARGLEPPTRGFGDRYSTIELRRPKPCCPHAASAARRAEMKTSIVSFVTVGVTMKRRTVQLPDILIAIRGIKVKCSGSSCVGM
jgi:hypothetical protein